MAEETLQIGLADALDPREDQLALALQSGEAHATVEGQARLGRIEHAQKVALQPALGMRAQGGGDLLDRRQEIAAEHDLAEARQIRLDGKRGRIGLAQKPERHLLGRDQRGGRPQARPHQRNAFASAKEKVGQGHDQELGALALLGQGGLRAVAHRGRAVPP